MRTILKLVSIAMLLVASTALPARAEDQPDTHDGREPARDLLIAGGFEISDLRIRVDGEAAQAIEPKQTASLRFTVRNLSDTDAKDAILRIEEQRGITIEPARVELGDIPAGDGADAALSIEIEPEVCFDEVGIGAVVASSLGELATKFAVPASCPGPRLSADRIRYVGGDGDDVPEPGETLDVYIRLRNDGRDPARALNGSLTVNGEGVRLTSADAEWPALSKGEDAENREPFVLRIADDAKRDRGCRPLDGVPVRDGDGVVSSDDVADGDRPVSSDGSTADEPQDVGAPDGAEPGSVGGGASGSAPGSTGSGTIEPDPATKESPPEVIEPMPPVEEPEPQDQPVAFELSLSVRGEDTSFETGFASGTVCALAEEMRGANRTAGPADDALAGADRTASSTTAAPVAALLLLAVGSALARRVSMR